MFLTLLSVSNADNKLMTLRAIDVLLANTNIDNGVKNVEKNNGACLTENAIVAYFQSHNREIEISQLNLKTKNTISSLVRGFEIMANCKKF